MRYSIGELTVGQILDHTFSLLKNHPVLLLGIAAIFYGPVLLIQGILTQLNTPDTSGANPQEAMSAMVESSPILMIIGIVFMVIYFILVGPLTTAGITHAVSKVYLDRSTTIRESIGVAFSKLLGLLGTSILAGIFIMVGFILFIIPGIYLALKYFLAQQVVVLEDTAGYKAMKRSGELMKGSMGIAFVLMFMIMIISFGVGFISALIPLVPAQLILSMIGQVFAVGLAAIATTVFYFHARAKVENYDLQILADSIGEDDSPSNQAPPPLPVME